MSRPETTPAVASTRSSGSDGSEVADGGSDRGEAPTPDRLTRRVVWTEETVDCASCGEPVDLATSHYYVAVDGTDSQWSGADRDERVFCSRSCGSEWC